MYDEPPAKTKYVVPFSVLSRTAWDAPRIKVRSGSEPLAGFSGETITARTRWIARAGRRVLQAGREIREVRAWIDIGSGIHGPVCNRRHAEALARYATLCQ